MENMHHSTITRWEVLCEAARIASYKNFNHDCQASISRIISLLDNRTDLQNRRLFCIEMYTFSMDATNSGVWQGAKLHGLHLLSSFLLRWDNIGKWPFQESPDSHEFINVNTFGIFRGF